MPTLTGLLVKIGVSILGTAIGGGLARAFGLHTKVERMLNFVVTSELVLLLLAGLSGLAALAALLAFRVEDRLYDLLSPRPSRGSFVYRATTIRPIQQSVFGGLDLDIIVDLENSNDFLIEYRADIKVNANTHATQIVLSGFAPAGRTIPLVCRLFGVPATETVPDRLVLGGDLQYDVRYFVPQSRRHRRTGRTTIFYSEWPVPGTSAHPLHVTFRDEIEE